MRVKFWSGTGRRRDVSRDQGVSEKMISKYVLERTVCVGRDLNWTSSGHGSMAGRILLIRWRKGT